MTDFSGLTDNLSDDEQDFVYNDSNHSTNNSTNHSKNIFNIYVLECDGKTEGYKYYIGKTNNDVSIRFTQHKSNDNTCAWTNKYKPIKILEIIQSKDSLDEDKITKKYMIKYGVENVRGGSYVKITLDDWMIKSLEHELIASRDVCYNCKEKGHYYKDCPLNNKFNILKYVKKFANMDDIDSEINKLEKVYEQIIILNHQIKQTNIFDKENDIKKKELEDKIKENGEKLSIYSRDCRKYNTEYQEARTIQQELNNSLGQINLNNDIGHINVIYKMYFVNDPIYINDHSNQKIKRYKLNIFNLEKKKELKEILNIEKSEDIIKEKLEGLYKKKILLIKID